MKIYKERKVTELDTSVFEYGTIYTISKNITKSYGYKLLVCCKEIDSTYVDFIIIDTITGSFLTSNYHLNVEDDPDPDLEINRVCIERDPQTQRVYLREEKTDYRALAEKLYNVLESEEINNE